MILAFKKVFLFVSFCFPPLPECPKYCKKGVRPVPPVRLVYPVRPTKTQNPRGTETQNPTGDESDGSIQEEVIGDGNPKP